MSVYSRDTSEAMWLRSGVPATACLAQSTMLASSTYVNGGVGPLALCLQRIIAVEDPVAEGPELPEGADGDAPRHTPGSAAACHNAAASRIGRTVVHLVELE